MKIYNRTQKKYLSKDALFAESFFDKVTGLLNKNNPRSIVFHTHFGLHTFGLTNPIDILVLDNDDRAVKTTKNFLPNRFYFYFDSHVYILNGQLRCRSRYYPYY